MSAYPWGWTTPNAGTFNLQDTGAYDPVAGVPRDRHATRRERVGTRLGRAGGGRPNAAGPTRSARPPRPQDPAVVCPADGPAPHDVRRRCLREGHRRAAALAGPAHPRASRPRCGSPWPARTRAWRLPAQSSPRRWPTRKKRWRTRSRPARRSPRTPRSTCPATRCSSRASRGASRTSRTPCRRCTTCSCAGGGGQRVPSPEGTLEEARWLGAGWPDYPWLFGTDGEYTAFASVAMGQFGESRRTFGRCATSALSSTATAARSSTR